MPRDRTTKKSLKSSFSDGLMVLCPAPCRKQYKLTASQRAQPKLAFKQQNCQNKVYSFLFFPTQVTLLLSVLYFLLQPQTWRKHSLDSRLEAFWAGRQKSFFSCSAVLNITNSEKIKKKKNSQKTPGGTRGRGGGGGETQDSPARPALAVHVHLGRVL